MSNDAAGQGEGDSQVDAEMASADRANGERPPTDEHRSARRSHGLDPEAPSTYVDDEDAPAVAEPNEPA